MNWSVLLKEGNSSPLMGVITHTMLQYFWKYNLGVIWCEAFPALTLPLSQGTYKNADPGVQHQIYQIYRIRILCGGGNRNL